MKDLDKKRVDTIIRFALKEDIWTGDVTTEAVVDRFFHAGAVILAREAGVVCGMDIAERVFRAVDANLKFKPMVSDGGHVEPDQEIAFIDGDAQSIMKGERTALNFLSMLSGVATKTHEMTELVKGTSVKIYDTRKTIPLHRYLQKYAVRAGGGYNHRKGLWDMVLIKDNHIRVFGMQLGAAGASGVIRKILKRAKAGAQKNIKIEIEVETLKECAEALDERPDVIMMDNMTPQMVGLAVKLRFDKGLAKDVLFEVSGGIRENNIKEYAATGVDIISIGALTSSIRPLDYSLEMILKDGKVSTGYGP